MLLEVSHSGNPLFTKFAQAIMQVNDCQISVFCMNQEDISVKVRKPLSHHAVNVRELHINTSLKAPPHFYDLCSTPFGYGTLWTQLSPDAGEEDSQSQQTQQKWGGGIRIKKMQPWGIAIATGRLYNSVERWYSCYTACSNPSVLQPRYSRVFAESNLWSCRKRLWINILEII